MILRKTLLQGLGVYDSKVLTIALGSYDSEKACSMAAGII